MMNLEIHESYVRIKEELSCSTQKDLVFYGSPDSITKVVHGP